MKKISIYIIAGVVLFNNNLFAAAADDVDKDTLGGVSRISRVNTEQWEKAKKAYRRLKGAESVASDVAKALGIEFDELTKEFMSNVFDKSCEILEQIAEAQKSLEALAVENKRREEIRERRIADLEAENESLEASKEQSQVKRLEEQLAEKKAENEKLKEQQAATEEAFRQALQKAREETREEQAARIRKENREAAARRKATPSRVAGLMGSPKPKGVEGARKRLMSPAASSSATAAVSAMEGRDASVTKIRGKHDSRSWSDLAASTPGTGGMM